MAIAISSSRFQFIGTFFFDVSVDNNASFFFQPGETLDATAVADRGVLTADGYTRFDSLLIVGDNTALTGAITVAVLKGEDLDETLDASWATLQSAGTDVAIALDKAVVIDTALAAPALRLESAGVEAADRTFRIYGRRPAV